jgi:uncharacterized membrane protein YeaQ/YmgE (transglycosylase-associated protein family)
MPILIGLLILIVLVAVLIWFSTSVLGFILHLVVAGLVGWAADLIIPGNLPFGWLGAILAGLVGSWLGVMLIGDMGPSLAGVPIIPAFLGALILAFLVDLFAKLIARPRHGVS